MTLSQVGYASNCCYIGCEWQENNSNAATFTITPIIKRWDKYSTSGNLGKFAESLSPDPSGAGYWSGYSWPTGSGWRTADTFATRTYNKSHSTQTITMKVSTDYLFSTITDSGYKSIGEVTATFTMTIPAKTSYTVSFNANGGSGAPGNQTKWYNESLTLSPTKPTRTGYTFKGWATTQARANAGTVDKAAGAAYTTNSAQTFYAVWQRNTWTVSYNANGHGTAPASQTKTYGQSLALQGGMGTVDNHVWKEWNTAADGSGTAYAASASYTANAAATLYAQWHAPYTVSYNANGGSGAPSAQAKVYNQALTLSSTIPTRANHDFLGWSTSSTATNATYCTGDDHTTANIYSTNADLALYAVWKVSHSDPTITNLVARRCLQDGTLADDGEYCKVTATVSVDNTTEGYADTKLKTVTVQVGSNSAESVTVDTTATSASIDFISANQLSLTSTYAVKLTVTDSHDFSSYRSSNISIAYFTMHFKEGGHGIAIGKKSVISNLFDVNMNTKVTGTLDTTGKITSLGEVEAQERLVVNANEDNYGAIRFNSENAACDGVRFYGSTDGWGDEIVVGAGGRLIAGSGESAYNLHNALIDAGNAPSDEHSFITADGHLYLFSHCNTIANRTQLMLYNSSDVELYGRCGADHAVSIDTSANNGVATSANIGELVFQDKNGTAAGWVNSEVNGSAGRVQTNIIARNKKTDGTIVSNQFCVCADKNGTAAYYVSNAANFRSAIWAACKPTQLYNNTSGSNGTITLSASAASYTHMRIYYKSTDDATHQLSSVDVYQPNGKVVILSCVDGWKSGNTWFQSRLVKINGTSIATYDGDNTHAAILASGGTQSNVANFIYILRVEGWNE